MDRQLRPMIANLTKTIFEQGWIFFIIRFLECRMPLALSLKFYKVESVKVSANMPKLPSVFNKRNFFRDIQSCLCFYD